MKRKTILSLSVIFIMTLCLTACESDRDDSSGQTDSWSEDGFEGITFEIDSAWKKDAVNSGDNISAASYYSSLSEENDKSDYTIAFLDYSGSFTYDAFTAGRKDGNVEESENGVSTTTNVHDWSSNGLSGMMYDVDSEYTDNYLEEYFSNVNMVGNILFSRSLVFEKDSKLYCVTCSVYNPDTKDVALENYEKVIDLIQ